MVQNRFSKLLLRVALYSVALFVYFTRIVKDNDITSNKLVDVNEGEYLIPNLSEIYDCVSTNLESKDSTSMKNFEKETEKDQSQNNSLRRTSIGPFLDTPSSELRTDSVSNLFQG